MIGLLSYGLFLTVLFGLAKLVTLQDRREQSNAAAAMLAARVI